MFVGRINKENPDVSRFTVDLSEWLDEGETATDILSHSITLGTTGWSNTPFPVPGSNPPYDPTPLLYTLMSLVDGGTAVEVYVSFGTPGNIYTCQIEVIGSTLREVNFEVGVQILGTPPAAPPIVVKPIPPDALSIMGGTMLGPLYLYEDPVYPTEAATKQYVDWAASQLGVDTKVNRAGDTMLGFLQLYANPVQPLHAATKNYVDMQTGGSLTDAPADGFVYGRQNFAWVKSVAEAPVDVFGYLRSNGAWSKGVPQGAALDVRVTEAGAGVPQLSAWQDPPSGNADILQFSARRTSSGIAGAGDGGVVQLFGPAYPSLASSVRIIAGDRTAAKVWAFNTNGNLTAAGPIIAPGVIRSDTGRLIAMNSGAQPSVVAWDPSLNVASGFWVSTGGSIRFGATDGNGVPQIEWANLTSTSLNVPSLGSAGTIASNNNLAAAGSLYVRGGNVFFGAGDTALMSSDGTNWQMRFRADNWNLTWNGTNGTLSFNTPSYSLFQVNGGGDGYFLRDLNCGGGISAALDVNANRNMSAVGNIAAAGILYAANASMIFGPGGSGRIMQFSSQWYWDWNGSNGDLYWQTPGGRQLICRQADQLVYNERFSMGGFGVYQNLSDIRSKRDVRPAPYGLAEILQLDPILFNRVSYADDRVRDDELGFSAQQLRTLIPEAVFEMGIPLPDGTGGKDDAAPTLGVGIDGVVVATVNAIKELEARIRALEAR